MEGNTRVAFGIRSLELGAAVPLWRRKSFSRGAHQTTNRFLLPLIAILALQLRSRPIQRAHHPVRSDSGYAVRS